MTKLSEDLIACRRRLNISLDDISKSTRVPTSLYISIEDGSFFNNPAFTRTYVRSFTRMYARALKIGEDDIVRALDEEENGQYSGFLYKKYILGEDGLPDPAPVATHTQLPPDPPLQPQPLRTPIDTDRNVDWADMGSRINHPKRNLSSGTYLIGAAVLILALAAGFFFWYNPIRFNSAEPETQPQQPVAEAPQTPVQAPAQPVVPVQPAAAAFPDTLYVTVYALHDKVDPVRITSDLKERTNPYWLEQGSARRFEFKDEIVVRAPFEKYILLFNGHIVEDRPGLALETDPISIKLTRDMLRNTPKYSRQGSLPDSIPAPREIQ